MNTTSEKTPYKDASAITSELCLEVYRQHVRVKQDLPGSLEMWNLALQLATAHTNTLAFPISEPSSTPVDQSILAKS